MSEARSKQIAMKHAIRIGGVTSVDQLDPVVKLFIEAFSTLMNDNENTITDIKERLPEQIAHSLTPDTLISAKPAHSIMKTMPVKPEMKIGRRDIFYTGMITNTARKYNLRHLNFAPVADRIKLVRREIQHILCERNLYRIGLNEKKELVTRATSFYQDLNRTIWLGLGLDGNPVSVETGIANAYNDDERYGGIFSHYNISYHNDEEVMELYRKQFLHVKSHVETRKLIKTPFATELTPFFSGRVNELEPQY